MKRYLNIIICLFLIISLCFSGCTGGNQTEYETGNAYAEDDTAIAFSDTGDMDLSFDGEAVTADDSDESAQKIVLGETTTVKTASAETTTAKTAKNSSSADATTNKASSAAVTTTSKASASVSSSEEVVNIKSGGTYTLSGTKNNIMVTVDAGDEDVQIILNGVTVKNSKGPALFIRSAGNVQLTLASGTVNTFTDGASYNLIDNGATVDGAIFSRADLTINGNGTMVVNGNYKHGIVSKDDLVIASGTVKVTSKNVGINGKDCVKINSGNITVNAGSDGIRSDNETNANKGFVYLYGGTVSITSGNDGIQAQTVIKVENANLTVKAGSGSSSAASSESAKGLKAGSDILISGGSFNLDTRDDCIHSDATVSVSGGKYTLSSGNDAVHADTDLGISGSGTVLTVNKCKKGLEGSSVVISGGTVSVVSADDGINASGGEGSSSEFTSSSGRVVISGGKLNINAGADGIDSKGSIAVSGGTVNVSVAAGDKNNIINYDTTASISGSTFTGFGSAAKQKNFSSASQGSVFVKTGSQNSGSALKVTDADGNTVISAVAPVSYSNVLFSSQTLKQNGGYSLTAGAFIKSFTVNSTLVNL